MSCSTWMPFSQRPEWSDVRPWYPESAHSTEEEEEADADEWKETHGYMHALLRSGECSPRAFEVATAVIKQNSADYSAWSLRWACVQVAVAAAAPESRTAPLLGELRFTEELAEESPKNYQLWNHRRLACAATASLAEDPAMREALAQREDAFTAAVLEEDAKNYHAWAHRAWMADFFHAHAQELAFTASHIQLDDRNNSAWNGRFTALERTYGHPSETEGTAPAAVQAASTAWPEEVASRELRLAQECIERDAANESAWAYARAVAHAASMQDTLRGIARAVLASHPGCSHAAGVLADAAEACAASAVDDGDMAAAVSAAKTARQLFAQCAASDPIRASYWMFRMHAGRMLT